MAATHNYENSTGAITQTLLGISNDIAAVSLAFNVSAFIFGCIAAFGVYITWKLYRSQQSLIHAQNIEQHTVPLQGRVMSHTKSR